MRCLPFLFFSFLFIPFAYLPAQNAPNAGQVAWYKQTVVIDQNKNRSNGDNTGQFISFTKMGCYDSDDKGYDIGNGFLEYKGLENNIHCYYGKTYWGQGSYFFNNDFSRLNIQTDSGIVYVYEKTSAPAGVVTSAKIRKPDTVVNTIPPVVPPSYTPPSSSGGGAAIGNRIKCKYCGGTGLCNICKGNYVTNCKYCDGVGKNWYGSGSNRKYETCAVCKGSGKSYCQCYEVFHLHGKCDQCRGKGYIDL